MKTFLSQKLNGRRLVLILVGWAAITAPVAAGLGTAQTTGDFDGDGYDDLVLGRSDDTVGNAVAGTVEVHYGSATGFSGSETWHQDVAGIGGGSETGDEFGAALATGDFDGDGYDDLAIGVPGEDLGTVNDAGAVNVIYGTSTGLSATGDQFWSQDVYQVAGTIEDDDRFGVALISGDFDDDGYDDLVVGVPGEDLGTDVDAGTVQILYGSSSGLDTPGNRFWNQDSTGILGDSDAGDRLGTAIASGDFDEDGYDDLAIGVPGEEVPYSTIPQSNAGVVQILYGSSSGLTATGNQLWDENSVHPLSWADEGNEFGASLGAGDYDDDGYDDLAVGIPLWDNDPWNDIDHGFVVVFVGSAGGLTNTGATAFAQSGAEVGDRFATSLAVGDFDGDGYDDLAGGAPGEDDHWSSGEPYPPPADVGSIGISYGKSSGLSRPVGVGSYFWDVDPVADERFGESLAVGDFDGDGYDDLVIGIPGYSQDAGQVDVYWGDLNRLSSVGRTSFY